MEEHRRTALVHLKNLITRQPSTSQSPEPPSAAPKFALDGLPTEILIQIISSLDLIDACCVSLASPRLYSINSLINPAPTPLTTPCLIFTNRYAALGHAAFEAAVIRWRTSIIHHKRYPYEPPLCRHSCSTDCALHFHIRHWMPAEMLFCNLCGKFANWIQPDGYRCPCKGKVRRRVSVGETRGLFGRLRRRRTVNGSAGGERRSEDTDADGDRVSEGRQTSEDSGPPALQGMPQIALQA